MRTTHALFALVSTATLTFVASPARADEPHPTVATPAGAPATEGGAAGVQQEHAAAEGHGEAAGSESHHEAEKGPFSLGVDMALGFFSPSAGNDTADNATIFSAVVEGAYRVAPGFEVALKVPFSIGSVGGVTESETTASGVSNTTSPKYTSAALGNLAIAAEFERELSEATGVSFGLTVALPTVNGDPNGSEGARKRAAVSEYSAASRGFFEDELFDPHRLSFVPEAAIDSHAGGFAFGGGLKVPVLIHAGGAGEGGGSEASINSVAVEVIPYVHGFYSILPERLSAGINAWMVYFAQEEESIDTADGSGPSKTQFVIEPQVKLDAHPAHFGLGYLLPLGGRLSDAGFAGAVHLVAGSSFLARRGERHTSAARGCRDDAKGGTRTRYGGCERNVVVVAAASATAPKMPPSSSRRPPLSRARRRVFGVFWALVVGASVPACGGAARHETRVSSRAPPVVFPPPERRTEGTTTDSVVLITIDGVRWQEVFEGVDEALAAKSHLPPSQVVTADRLLPNIYRRLVERGAAIGAPGYGGTIMASGPNFVSLPGYMEILSGVPSACGSNTCPRTSRTTTLDRLTAVYGSGDNGVAAISSWEMIDNAASATPAGITITAGRHRGVTRDRFRLDKYSSWLLDAGAAAGPAPGHDDYRPDHFTAPLALHYLERQTPRVFYIGLGDTDEYAHADDYRGYLRSLRYFDDFIGRLFAVLDARGPAGDRTTVIVTTDHGRAKNFSSHGGSASESGRVWMLAAGGAVSPRGFVETAYGHRLADVAPTMLTLLDHGRSAENGHTGGIVIAELFAPTPRAESAIASRH